MSDRLEVEIASLPSMNRKELIEKWQSELREPAPKHLRKEVLVPLLSYKLQEREYGGLSHALKRQLRKLARSFESGTKDAPLHLSSATRIKSGTRFVREWQGQTHTVTVCEDGFEYGAERYKSLSQIARKITGTRWSGPLFFGLRQNGKKA